MTCCIQGMRLRLLVEIPAHMINSHSCIALWPCLCILNECVFAVGNLAWTFVHTP